MWQGMRKSILREEWEQVRLKLRTSEAARNRVRNKRYTYYEATSNNLGVRVDEERTEQAPESVTALHLLATRTAPVDIVESMVTMAPESLLCPSEPAGLLPLHYASASPRSTKEMIEIMARSEPSAGVSLTGSGETPLHLACKAKRSVRVLRTIVEHADAMALDIVDHNGRTPWQVLMRNTSWWWDFWYRRAARRVLCQSRPPPDSRIARVGGSSLSSLSASVEVGSTAQNPPEKNGGTI